MAKRTKKPWPTKDVMTQIYDQQLWGGEPFEFYSGFGSHYSSIVAPYVMAVTNFLSSFEKPITVCDLGCGDFNIGKNLVQHTKNYIAIDIVEDLITRNKRLFKEGHLEFLCLDISKNDLPLADCVIIRQVLQHLSNSEIQKITNKLHNYNYLVLTEHIPIGDFIPNKDIIAGQGIRLKQNSGVNLLEAPFNLKIQAQKLLNAYFLENNKGKIVTMLYTL